MTIIKKSDLIDFADALYFLKEGKTVKQKDFTAVYKMKGKKIFKFDDLPTSTVINTFNTELLLAEDWVVVDD